MRGSATLEANVETVPTQNAQPAERTTDATLRTSGGGRGVRRRSSVHQRLSQIFTSTPSQPIITATLVEEPEVVMAERVFFSSKQWRIAIVLGILSLTVVVALLSIFLAKENTEPTLVPTASPTMSPTFDSKPTLQLVQERGNVSCLASFR